MCEVLVQRITNIILRSLSDGSHFLDQQKTNKTAFHLLLKAYFKYFYTTAKTTNWTNKTRTITQITSMDEYNKLLTKSVTLVFRCRNVIIHCKIKHYYSLLQVLISYCLFKTKACSLPNNDDTHPVSFSAVSVLLRHNRLWLPEYYSKRVCFHSKRSERGINLNRASLSACVRQQFKKTARVIFCLMVWMGKLARQNTCKW